MPNFCFWGGFFLLLFFLFLADVFFCFGWLVGWCLESFFFWNFFVWRWWLWWWLMVSFDGQNKQQQKKKTITKREGTFYFVWFTQKKERIRRDYTILRYLCKVLVPVPDACQKRSHRKKKIRGCVERVLFILTFFSLRKWKRRKGKERKRKRKKKKTKHDIPKLTSSVMDGKLFLCYIITGLGDPFSRVAILLYGVINSWPIQNVSNIINIIVINIVIIFTIMHKIRCFNLEIDDDGCSHR